MMEPYYGTMSHNMGHCLPELPSTNQLYDQCGNVKKQSGTTVQSVDRAIAILKSFSSEKPERGVAELARELGLHKSTVSRLLITLERNRLVSRDPATRRYGLGLDLIGLAAGVIPHLDVREVSRPFLRQLSETCQETVNLSVLDGGRVVNMERFVPEERQVKNAGWVGRRMCLHCTATGKALMAYLAQDELDQILAAGLEAFTPRTISDADRLRQELISVRAQGYATAEGELVDGLNVVAAPVRDRNSRVIASISISGPAYRVRRDQFHELAVQLVDVAAAISDQLGQTAL